MLSLVLSLRYKCAARTLMHLYHGCIIGLMRLLHTCIRLIDLVSTSLITYHRTSVLRIFTTTITTIITSSHLHFTTMLQVSYVFTYMINKARQRYTPRTAFSFFKEKLPCTSARSLHYLQTLEPSALGNVYSIVTCTSVCNLLCAYIL